jgi:hypothetical protein
MRYAEVFWNDFGCVSPAPLWRNASSSVRDALRERVPSRRKEKGSPPYHLLSEKLEPLQRPHRLGARVDIAKNNVGLPAHLHGLERHDVEHGAVGAEQRVERQSQVLLWHLVG